MRIGVMLRHLGEPGGIGIYTLNMLDALFELDRENRYTLLYKSADRVGRFAGIPNVTEKVLPASSKLWWDQITVPRFARAEGLDLIFNPKLSVPLFTGSKTVLVMHGAEQFAAPWAFDWHDRAYFKLANRLYCKKASAVVSMTHNGAKDIANYMGAAPEKIHVIHESYNERCRVVETHELLAVKEKYSLPDKFVLFVGGIHPLKNFSNLLRAYDRIRNSFPHKLVAVGFKRRRYSQDFELVDKLGLRDHVAFPGYVDDEEIPAFYNLADLFVLPSFYEGFGIPVLEAMASGCPVITTTTGCSPEVAGGAAILVDPYNPDEIAEAMSKVLLEDRLRQELIEKGLQRAKQFSWEKCARETLDVLETAARN